MRTVRLNRRTVTSNDDYTKLFWWGAPLILKVSRTINSSLNPLFWSLIDVVLSNGQFLLALCEIEQQQRYTSRVQRFLKESGLPSAKSLSNFDFTCCPTVKEGLILQLAQDSSWLKRGENLWIFGPSGVGKTHLAAGLGRSLIELNVRVKFLVKFLSATFLVQ